MTAPHAACEATCLQQQAADTHTRPYTHSRQLEGILYACSRHCELLPSGERAGFFIGDGAGVGKGRQIAGCILDNYARGRR